MNYFVNLIDLSHDLQTIINDINLPVYLVDDITRFMRFEFGEKTFCKILFKGLQSLKDEQSDDALLLSITGKLNSVSNYSSNIITKQKIKNKKYDKKKK